MIGKNHHGSPGIHHIQYGMKVEKNTKVELERKVTFEVDQFKSFPQGQGSNVCCYQKSSQVHAFLVRRNPINVHGNRQFRPVQL
jgi:hypothetical protein